MSKLCLNQKTLDDCIHRLKHKINSIHLYRTLNKSGVGPKTVVKYKVINDPNTDRIHLGGNNTPGISYLKSAIFTISCTLDSIVNPNYLKNLFSNIDDDILRINLSMNNIKKHNEIPFSKMELDSKELETFYSLLESGYQGIIDTLEAMKKIEIDLLQVSNDVKETIMKNISTYSNEDDARRDYAIMVGNTNRMLEKVENLIRGLDLHYIETAIFSL